MFCNSLLAKTLKTWELFNFSKLKLKLQCTPTAMLASLTFLLLVDVQNTQQEIGPGIQQVPPLRNFKDYILNCLKKKRTPIGKRIDFLRMQNVTPKFRRNVLNAIRLSVTVSQENDRLKRQTKLLNARRLIVTVLWEHDRLKRRTKLLNARRLNRTVWKDNSRLKLTSNSSMQED